ncbi:UNVERIFIED_CONTAM: putative metal-nicotianamine transporter YSL5 [Sesamum radiatum]|uniref:Metal-nicotianamine transporter YSL5 n=1 Tax=Sesamum radiatum TaxID=300843 RepID=A0AAW2PKM9_SESRA
MEETADVRAFAVSFLLSVMFCFIVMKLNLTTGIIPSLNVSAGLLGFFFVKTWTKLIAKSGMLRQPFTRQENTVIQTCVVASSGIAFSGGFGSYLFGMSKQIAQQSEHRTDGFDYKNPSLGWMIGFLFVVSFLGLFSVVPLRKIMIIDFKLTYPSGTATAHLINSFHTPEGAKLAKTNVGLQNSQPLGCKHMKNKFFFDFSATYVGVGMICPHIINVSVLVGGILSWGIMWPLIENRKGDWFSADLPSTSFRGLQGYKVFIGIAMILGDGLYNFCKVLSRTLAGLFLKLQERKANSQMPVTQHSSPSTESQSYDDQRRSQLFLKDQIPNGLPLEVMLPLPQFLQQLFLISSTTSNGFQDRLLDLGFPRSMFVSQVIGTAMGCVISPCVFWIFYNAFPDIGYPTSAYPAPFATVYYNMAKLGVEGFSALPKNCLTLCYVFFAAAILINMVRDSLGKKRSWFIPLPMAMAIPFYLGSYFAIDMCVGSLILYIWQKVNKAKADAFGPAVASGLICGDGMWTLPSSVLALAGVKPPICMKFLSRATNSRVDKFLGS